MTGWSMRPGYEDRQRLLPAYTRAGAYLGIFVWRTGALEIAGGELFDGLVRRMPS